MTHAHPPFGRQRRRLLAGSAAAFALPGVRAQRPMARVGWLGWIGARGLSASVLPFAAFRSGLAERGWTEGKDLEIVVREGDRPQSAPLATELLRQGIDVLVAQGPMVFGAKEVSGHKPLVFNISGDPVGAGLVASLAQPGGTLTGVTALSPELAGKRVELLREALKRRVRIAVIANELHPGVAVERQATSAAAARLGLGLSWYPLKSAADLEGALAAVAREGVDGMVAVHDTLIVKLAPQLAEFATARRLPGISGVAEFAEAGNLLSYGPSQRGYFLQVADIVDRLLRGARPADVAVEQARDVELVVNTRAARSMGLALPAELLLRADRRID